VEGRSRQEVTSTIGEQGRRHTVLEWGFFAPSFVTTTVRDLQKVFMTDACHLHFGKNTLFLFYGITANAIASPVAFAIILGNENTSSWHQFWNYAVKLHQYLDSADVTIITNQEKGKKNAIAELYHGSGTSTVLITDARTSSRCVAVVVGKSR
jgi:hypothetical protein